MPIFFSIEPQRTPFAGPAVPSGFVPALGYEEQADPAHAGGRVGQLRQDKVNDILGQIVLSGRDEYLGAGNRVAVVPNWRRPGADLPEIGPAMGFGQAHGAAPAAVGQPGQIGFLQVVGGMRPDQRRRALREQRVDAEGEIGGADHLVKHHADQLGQSLAAIVGRDGHAGPARFHETAIGFLEAPGRAHRAVLVVAALLVGRTVERQQRVLAELRALLDHGVDHVRRRLLIAGQGRQRADIEELVEHETHVAERGAVGLHDRYPIRDSVAGRHHATAPEHTRYWARSPVARRIAP